MIRFTLKCDSDHRFDGWFKSSEVFDDLCKAGHVACTVCGSHNVEKSLMSPAVTPARSKAAAPVPMVPEGTGSAPSPAGPPSSGQASSAEIEAALKAMRKQVEENSDYVGMEFASEARKIHDGDAPDRAIYGQAKPEEAKKLIEDGVPVAPLPFVPKRQVN